MAKKEVLFGIFDTNTGDALQVYRRPQGEVVIAMSNGFPYDDLWTYMQPHQIERLVEVLQGELKRLEVAH